MDDKIRGYLKIIIIIHNSSTMILFTSNICFSYQPCCQYGLLVDFIPFFLYLHHQAHLLSFVGITCFTSTRLDSIINILVLLDVSFFSCFLLAQVTVNSPNVSSLLLPNFLSFFLLLYFVQLAAILLLQLVLWSSLFLCYFSNQLGISHPNWTTKFLLH